MTSTYSKRTSQSGSAQAPADNLDKAADYGRDAAEGAKGIASEATASVKTEMRKILDQQIEHGSAYLGHAAHFVEVFGATVSAWTWTDTPSPRRFPRSASPGD